MFNFLETATFNDSFSGGRVQMQLDLKLRFTAVLDQRAHAQGFRCAANYSILFSFR